MGIYYLGPVDGHDMDKLIKILTVAKRINGPVLVHVVTQKGRGYKPAERNPSTVSYTHLDVYKRQVEEMTRLS